MTKGAKIKGNEFGYIGSAAAGWLVVWKPLGYAEIGRVRRLGQKRFAANGREYVSRDAAARGLAKEASSER